jgi:hypothetical protein
MRLVLAIQAASRAVGSLCATVDLRGVTRIKRLALLLAVLASLASPATASAAVDQVNGSAFGAYSYATNATDDLVVIGKVDDLTTPGAVRSGETTLLDRLPNQGSPRLNWEQNSSVLRTEMSRGLPIRDASVDPLTGNLINNTGFLRAERNLLTNQLGA